MENLSENSVVVPEGLCHMIILYGELPRPAYITPEYKQLKSGEHIYRAMNDVQKENSKRKLALGQSHAHWPKEV